VIEKEIERTGIPTVLITTLTSTARMIGANRIIEGMGITNPVGKPKTPEEEEHASRKKLVYSALELLAEK
jgi:glycine/betaine/sarcosine/D-proline reductase family selenoprotein B